MPDPKNPKFELRGALSHRAPSAPFEGLAQGPRAGVYQSDYGVSVFCESELVDRAPLAKALGEPLGSDAALIARAYQRFGNDAWLRLQGRFTVALWDQEMKQLVLARAPSPLSAPLYWTRAEDTSRFSCALQDPSLGALRKTPLNRAQLERWLSTGHWTARNLTAFEGLQSIAPGEYVTIAQRGRTQQRAYWNFTPLAIPRALELTSARTELRAQLRASLGIRADADRAQPWSSAQIWAERGAQMALHEALGASPPNARSARFQLPQLEAVARLTDQPLPLSSYASLAGLLSLPERTTVVTDLGARALLGATTSARVAWLRTLAGALDTSPNVGTLARVVRDGWKLDQQLGPDRALRGAIQDTLGTVARRWAGHVPALAARLPLAEPPAQDEDDAVPRVTPDPFTNQRFAEVKDRVFDAQATALRNMGLFAHVPFIERPMIEFAFSIPPKYLLTSASDPLIALDAQPPESLPKDDAVFRDLGERATRFAGSGAGPEDRRLGLGLFLRCHRDSD